MDDREIFHAAHVLQQHEHVAVAQAFDRGGRRRRAPGVIEQGLVRRGQLVHPIADFAGADDADVVLAGVHRLQLAARLAVVGVALADRVAGISERFQGRAHRRSDVQEIRRAHVARPGRKVVDEDRDFLFGVGQMPQAQPARRDVADEADPIGNRFERADLGAAFAGANRRQRLNALGFRGDDVADVFEHRDAILGFGQVGAREGGIDG